MSENVDQHASEVNSLPVAEARSLEGTLKALWERAKRAGELIAQLREERAGLQHKLDLLERELARLKEELNQKDELMKKLNTESARPPGKNGVVLSDGERQQMGMRVKELIAKIEGYL